MYVALVCYGLHAAILRRVRLIQGRLRPVLAPDGAVALCSDNRPTNVGGVMPGKILGNLAHQLGLQALMVVLA